MTEDEENSRAIAEAIEYFTTFRDNTGMTKKQSDVMKLAVANLTSGLEKLQYALPKENRIELG